MCLLNTASSHVSLTEKYSNFCILITTTEKGRRQERKGESFALGLDGNKRAAKRYVHCTKCVLNSLFLSAIILPYEKFLQFDWLRAVVFQLNLKYLHVKITNLLRVVV